MDLSVAQLGNAVLICVSMCTTSGTALTHCPRPIHRLHSTAHLAHWEPYISQTADLKEADGSFSSVQ